MKKLTDKYASFVSNNALVVLIIFLIFSGIMLFGSSLLQNKSLNYEDMLPQDYDVIKAFKMISQDFGGTTSATILIQIDNSYSNSNELKSVADPQLITYSKKLEDYLATVSWVNGVKGIGNLVYDYYSIIPNSINEVRVVSKSSGASSLIAEDESLTIITLSLDENVDPEKFTHEVEEVINNLDKPVGIKVSPVGDTFASSIIMKEIGPSMEKTSYVSIAAIIIILFLLFKNIKSVVLPLMAILFGVLWTMGFLGFLGSGLSTMTSGTISMIMGVGIDFGIQIMTRFNYELKKNKKKKAMEETLKGTLIPILITALACLVGFKAMGLGELTLMAEIGDVMSYGVVFCMLAAITIVPSLLLLLTKDKPRNKNGEIIEDKKTSWLKKFIGIN